MNYENGSVYHQYVIKTKKRTALIKYLKKNKIEYGIHYPISINNLKIVKKKFKNIKFPNSEKLANECISLPIDPSMKINQIKKVIKTINSY